MKITLIILLSIYLLGVILLFTSRYKYYSRVVKSEYKRRVPMYALGESLKWPVFVWFGIGVMILIIIDGFKYRKQRKMLKFPIEIEIDNKDDKLKNIS